MRALRAALVRLLAMFDRGRADREFAEELDSHLQLHIDDNLRAGLPPDEARRLALARIGSVTAVREARRERHGLPAVDAMLQDAQYAARTLMRNPGFAAGCIATLALGIGINSAIFSVVNAVLLAPLPYREPDRLVAIWRQHPSLGDDAAALSAADVADLARGVSTMRGVEALQTNIVPAIMSVGGRAFTANGVRVSAGMFELLGRDALLGRCFTRASPDGVVLSHAFWRRELGADPSVIGRPLNAGASALTVVGVMPPSFAFPYASMLRAPVSFTGDTDVDYWVALPSLGGARETPGPGRATNLLAAVARLDDGVGLDQARADVEVAWRQVAMATPDVNGGWQALVVPLHQQAVAPVRGVLLLLLAGVGVVLLIACVNVTGMLLGRGLARQREMALRAALGAGRARLLQQALIESLVLSATGAAVGWLLARWATPLLVRWAPTSTPRLEEVALDWRIAGFAGLLAIAVGVVIGLAPAIGTAGVQARAALSSGGRTQSASRHRLRGLLVASEAALAVVLTVAAALLIRSFVAVLTEDAGFKSDHLLTLALTAPGQYDTPARRLDLYRRLFERLEAIPGVEAAGATTRLPLGGANSTTEAAVDGSVPTEGQWPRANLRRAMHQYFRAMGIPLRRGRWFDARDREGAPPVVVVNETFARRWFGDADPIGRQVLLGNNAPVRVAQVIGVVGDLRHEGLDVAPAPEVYVHGLQAPPAAPLIVLRTTDDPAALAPAVRAAVRAIDSSLSPYDIRTMDDLRSASVAGRRFLVRLAGAFGVVALLLAAIGVYGMMALLVTERRRELGIRLALGARPRALMAQVLRQAVLLAGTGGAAGMAVALLLSPLMAGYLYAVGPRDPVSMIGVAALLMFVAATAAAIPASRVLRVDPAATLRCD